MSDMPESTLKSKISLKRRKRSSKYYKNLINFRKAILPTIVVILGVIFVAVPFIWIFSTSIKPSDQIFHIPVIYIPKEFTWQNYIIAWQKEPLLRWYINTIIVSVSATFLGMFLATFAGYGFSRFRIKGKGILLISILLSQMFPQILIVIPYFVWMNHLHLVDSYFSLIIAYLGGILPFSIWTLKGFFDTLPPELDQAARIDGCGNLSTFFKIILPLSTPGIAAVTLFAFLTSWNNYLLTLILVTNTNMLTLNVGITKFISELVVQWGPLNAVAVMTSLPIIIAFVFFEKYMVAGLTAGAVKG
jgi:ABC-type glycerol-3-phosphate transport system permease component